MAIVIPINIDLSDLSKAISVLPGEIFPAVSNAVKDVAQRTVKIWEAKIQSAPLSVQQRGAYRQSIDWIMTGDYSATVYSTYSKAEEIENGRPRKDLKKMLTTSRKTRTGKKGRYLIIPFRHNVPGANALGRAMPKEVYAEAKLLTKSRVVGMGQRLSASGYLVPQARYKWGGRLPAGLQPRLKKDHATDIYAGMVRMNTSAGRGKSSAYMTFRTMTASQTNKWIIPEKPGLHIAQQVEQEAKTMAQVAFTAAMKNNRP